ncbi:MAG: SPASM domain-containing protein [Desulfuromonadales bacterium]
MPHKPFTGHIHLLYVPTLACNLACRYCYLGEQTSAASLKQDASRAAATLRRALDTFLAAGVLPFNVSLHGGEPTMLPPVVLEELFGIIRTHYRDHFDELTARGFRKSAPHIKTNLYNFHKLYDLFDRHRVSVSASIDLPLRMHEKLRTTRQGRSWMKQTVENLKLLARYPHAKKISSTLYREHLQDIPALIADIRHIHHEIGFDMNRFNFMFGFESAGNLKEGGEAVGMLNDREQALFYEAMRDEFTGTDLEEGLRRSWFEEFTPSFCTNSFNCGERFFLLQSDGEVWSCVRGQGLEECRFGNVLHDPVEEILAAGRARIARLHQQAGLDSACRDCGHLHICHTGCPVVKLHSGSGKSYTCLLQKAIYRDNHHSYPLASTPEEQRESLREYAFGMHPALSFDKQPDNIHPRIVLPNDLNQQKNALTELIAADPVLCELYGHDSVFIEINGEMSPLRSPLIKEGRTLFSLSGDDRVAVHLKRSLFAANCSEPVRNTLHLQMLRDTTVVYGDEQRSKQEHIFTYQLFHNLLEPSHAADGFVMADLTLLLHLHRQMYQAGVLNNLFVTTGYLREYHYQKQKANAFYHIQAINLPFQNVEFYWDEQEQNMHNNHR